MFFSEWTESDKEEEEEVLDEESQLMVKMGLPLSFASSSAQRREVNETVWWVSVERPAGPGTSQGSKHFLLLCLLGAGEKVTQASCHLPP